MVWLQVNMQIKAGVRTFVVLKLPGNNRPRKTGLVPDKRVGFGSDRSANWFFGRRSAADLFTAASHGNHVRRNRNAHRRGEAIDPVPVHREPASCIEQITGVVGYRCKL